MSYQLRTDTFGRKRLNIQGELYNPASWLFLIKQDIKPGQSILEVGCGGGAMTPFLAQLVGKKGRVLAIDNSHAQVKATEQLIQKIKLNHVECRELSVFDVDQLKEKFDVIYVRWVLVHLKDPFTALAQLVKQLKKGGKIIIDEMLNSYNFSHPENKYFAKRRYAIEQFFIRNGLDPNLGLLLKPALQKIKLKKIEEGLFQPLIQTKSERNLLTLFFHEIKDKLIALKILTEKEWHELMAGLEKLAAEKNNTIALSSMYQIAWTR